MQIMNENDYIQAMLIRTMANKTLAIFLFKKLFLEIPERIQLIRIAIHQKKLFDAQTELHKLRGSFGFCGCTELDSLSNTLEKNLSLNELKKIKKNLIALENKINYFNSLSTIILTNLSENS